jgi:hypothetical protein
MDPRELELLGRAIPTRRMRGQLFDYLDSLDARQRRA